MPGPTSDEKPRRRLGFNSVLALSPVVRAVAGPFYVSGEHHWAVKALIGFLFGASFFALGLKGQFEPPMSTILAAACAALLFASLLVLTVVSPVATRGTLAVGALVSGAMFWALTR